ncbi:Cx9C motif-containing protein 4, mitochondrial [Neopestalotiopsis sp. 37M]|nr:Cx9C motif-containing protein 4, mitochondrial [Neopestalotiopsis sp. 37M]
MVQFALFLSDQQDVQSRVCDSVAVKMLERDELTMTDCLTKNNYKESKCQGLIDALYDCCDAFYKKNGDSASTVSCPKPDLLRLKLKQRQEERSK